MSDKPKYSISFLCHSRLDCIKKSLPLIKQYSRDYELIITANAVSTEMMEYLEEYVKGNEHARLIMNEKNLGFGIPHNRAFKESKGDYFIVLNDDIYVCPNWLDLMYWGLKKHGLAQIGILGNCCTLTSEGTGTVGPVVEYVEASCMMLPRKVLKKYGLFDTDMYEFIYCEDSDLSLRLRDHGEKVGLIELPITHDRCATTKEIPALSKICELNKVKLRKRWDRYLRGHSFDYHILIKRTYAKGDLLWVTPVLRALKEKWPHSHIWITTVVSDMLRGCPFVSGIADWGNFGRFDETFDLDLVYERNPQKLLVDTYAERCGVTLNDHRPVVSILRDDLKWARDTKGGNKCVVFHTSRSDWAGRQYPMNYFSQIAAWLKNDGYKIIEVGDGLTTKMPEANVTLLNLTLSRLAAIIKGEIFVGLDSMPSVIAMAVDTPAAIIFGCIDPKMRIPPDCKKQIGVFEDVGCNGCHHRQPAPRMHSDCARGDPVCMLNLKPEKVYGVVKDLISKYKHE